MTVSELPSGRFRAQVWHDGKWVSVPKVIGGPASYPNRKEAEKAKRTARVKLDGRRISSVTVAIFRERWITDPLFSRPKESTNLHNAERTKAFAEKYGSLPLDGVSDAVVSEWLAGGKRNGTLSALRAMFNDARSAKGGRLIQTNPFAGLGISKGPGNRHKDPPAQEMVWTLIEHARKLVCPGFAAWLQVAAFTGMRPGELDALRWDAVDFARSRIRVDEQFNAKTRTFTEPKTGRRVAPLTKEAREILMATPHESDFCFVTLRATHWTASSRAYHWKAVKSAAGYTDTLYLATRHHAGWFMRNALRMDAEDVAVALGHTDGGELVRKLYGHLDKDAALDRVVNAYDAMANVRPFEVVRKDAG